MSTTQDVEPTAAPEPPAARRHRSRPDRLLIPHYHPGAARHWPHLTLPGAWVALALAALSFLPSLLPRSWLVQGVLCGVDGVIGYALGVVGGYVWRAFADREARPARVWAWRFFLAVAGVVLVGCVILAWRLQSELRGLMDVRAPALWTLVLLPVAALLVFVVVLMIGRALRGLYLLGTRQLNRVVGERAARGVSWAAVVLLTWSLASGVLGARLTDLVDRTFSLANGVTADGVEQPTLPTRSGSPGSLASWDSLGREGRTFVGKGPSAADISRFTGAPAKEPVRAYAGLETDSDTEQRATTAVADLARAGGFDRSVLVVATTTGSGWVDAAAVGALEYQTGGDSAVVAIQYSYLPSWLSYLVDQAKAQEAGRDLFEAVYGRWLELPEDRRPQLLLFGESLGSFGGEAAFSGEFDLRNRTDGALFAGPPNFNTLHRRFTGDRDPGTPEIEPVYRGGRIVRFDDSPTEPPPPAGQAWTDTRVLYLQHPSDPIVWWDWNLAFSRPDWLSEPRGSDVSRSIRWFPIVTFWQITADLPQAQSVPDGHGHTYQRELVEGWAAVLQPEGWTEAKTDQLSTLLMEQD